MTIRNAVGPRTEAADQLHAMKYRGEGEDFREAMNRVSFALKDTDSHYHDFREIILDQRFLPPGRVQSAMGASRETTPYNCYVSGTIEDSFVSGDGSIMQRAHEAAATMRMGGGIGYDFSSLRPSGDAIRKLQSISSGPVSFMSIFNEIGLCTASSGHRRGAQMGVMRIDHPDIEKFIRAKQNNHALVGFNISAAVTDDFMEALYAGKDFDLTWAGRPYRTVNAEELWEKIMRSTWDYSEPGVLFIDAINRMNNLYYCEKIAATNPCGEQPLPPFGACLLGSFNLVKYLRTAGALRDATTPGWYFDYDQLMVDIPPVVRAMDNVCDRARFPLPAQKVEAQSKRRMGLGVTGLANAGEAMGLPYGSPGFLTFTAKVLEIIRNSCYMVSANLAKEKGSFSWYDSEKYMAGEFVNTLPDEVRWTMQKFGMRNSHLTSIAPTGTISMTADNVSSGLEPVIYHSAKRKINTPDGQMEVIVNDYGVENFGVKGRIAESVSPAEHVAVLCAAQPFVDSAISKTCNVDAKTGYSNFRDLYRIAHKGGAKGLTTYNKDGLRGSIMSDASAPEVPEGAVCTRDEAGNRECG